jgi:hypothetical protein
MLLARVSGSSFDAIPLYANIIGVEVKARGEEMAETQNQHSYRSFGNDLVNGRYLPWICAFSAIGLLSFRVGPMISVIIATASCVLLLVILAGAQLYARSEESPEAEKDLIACSARVTWKLSSMRAAEVLVLAV